MVSGGQAEAVHRSIVFVDIAGSTAAGRRQGDKVKMIEALPRVLDEAVSATRAGAAQVTVRERGDGALILFDPAIPKVRLVTEFARTLVRSLLRYNSGASEQARMRLRVAAHHGEVVPLPNEEVGSAIDETKRLCDAQQVKGRLRESSSVLVLVVSRGFYQEVVRGDPGCEPHLFEEFAEIVQGKTYRGWMRAQGEMPWAVREEDPPLIAVPAQPEPVAQVPDAPRERGRRSLPQLREDDDDPSVAAVRAVLNPGGPGRATAVVLFGPAGSGRSRALRVLRGELLAGHQPHALIALPRHTRRRGRAVHELLFVVLLELAAQRWKWGFPRFLADCAAIAAPARRGDEEPLPVALERLRERLEVPAPDGVLAGIARRATRGRWRRGRVGVEARDEVAALLGLDTAQARADLDLLVLRHFLADLDDALPERARLLDPTVLVDDTVDPTALLVAWRRAREWREDRGQPLPRLALVTTGERDLVRGLGLLAEDGGPGPRLAEGLVVPERRRDVSSVALTEPLTALPVLELTERQVDRVVRAAGAGGRGTAEVVHALAAGHAAATRELALAAALLGGEAATPDELLSAPSSDDVTPVGDRVLNLLLDGLVVGSDALVACAAARTLDEAATLITTSGLHPRSDLFSLAVWSRTGPGGAAVMHPLLRLLLLRRLASRPEADTGDWCSVFAGLAKLAERRGDEAGRLHHLLAAGEVEEVVWRVEESLERDGGEAWLDVVRVVTTSPLRPGADVRAQRDSPVRSVLLQWQAANDPHRAAHRREHHSRVATGLREVAARSRDGHLAFRRAIREHEERADR
ncbi:nucleotidyl cyclase domain-containing protein [Actinosynnema pretiosum]|uniref:hypothetical protein n=1 Tax=Actinosynnema pretiosum TaxID=42197 RepID=UPI0012FE7939|nr:hypothetical protein [Actinosynnema pretiosum]